MPRVQLTSSVPAASASEDHKAGWVRENDSARQQPGSPRNPRTWAINEGFT